MMKKLFVRCIAILLVVFLTGGGVKTVTPTEEEDSMASSLQEEDVYGHPHRETLDLLDNESMKFKVYRTDINGDIVVKSNGKELSFETSK